MAREFKSGIKITGNAQGGVQATRAAREELDKLNKTQRQGAADSKLSASSLATMAARATAVAAAAGAAVGVIGRFAKSIADQGDRLQKLSIQLGTSTEFLSSMSFAADLSGVSLDTLSVGIRKMEKSVGDLSAGLSTQVRAFDRLGLSYENIRTLSPEDQFLLIAERLGGMEDKSLRVATAMDIFGRSGAELIPLLAQGGEGIAEMRAEAERLGLVMSQEFADQSAQFNDELTRMQGIMTGVKREIGEGLLPSLTAVMQSFIDSAEASDTWKKAGTVLGNVVRVVVAGFIAIKETVELAAKAVWAAGKVIIETLVAIAAPFVEFGNTLATAFEALIRGDFSAAADAFSGLGDRMAASFVDNISVVKLTLQEFGQDASGQISDAISKVNDILLRQAKISQDVAEGVGQVGEDTKKAAAEADQAAKAFQSLADRLDPLAALGRKFSIEQAILLEKIEAGGEGVAEYKRLLALLKEEYTEAALEAVGFGESAEKAAEKAAKAAEREAEQRAKALAKQQADLETFQKAFERGIERLDDLGADLWRGWFTGAKNAMDSIKDFFLNWLAELANAAITRPILVNIVGSLGLAGPAAAIAGGGGIPGAVGTAGAVGQAAGGIGGLGGFAGIASLLSGTGIGNFFAGLPSFLGGSPAANLGPTFGISQGGLFGNAAGVSNLQFGVAGILGGLLSDKIFGGAGGIGGGLGATIGTAILPGLGSIVGGLLGGALGGLFGGKKPVLDITGFENPNRKGDQVFFESGLGGFFARDRRIDDASVKEFGDAIANFDNVIAGFLSSEQVAAATDALSSFRLQLEGGAIDLETFLSQRFSVILSTVSEDIQAYVREVSGLEEQVQRLGLATVAQRILDAAPELFEGRTFREFIDVAQQMQAEGEELTATFDRLVQAVAVIADQITLVRGFAASDLEADFRSLLAQQDATPGSIAADFAQQIRDLGDSFTGSAADLQILAGLVTGRYQSEIAFLQQIDGIINGLSQSFRPLREQIERSTLTDEQFFDRTTAQAEELAAALATMTDPAQIAATVAEIQRLTSTAFGLLDEGQKAGLAAGFLDFLDAVEDTALDRLTTERDTFLGESAELRAFVDELAAGFGDPLSIAAEAAGLAADELSGSAEDISAAARAHQESALRLSEASQMLAEASSGLGTLGLAFGDAVTGLRNLSVGLTGGTAPVATIISTPPKTGASSVLQVGQFMGRAVTGAIQEVGSATVQAIKQAGSQTQVVVVQPSRGMVNR